MCDSKNLTAGSTVCVPQITTAGSIPYSVYSIYFFLLLSLLVYNSTTIVFPGISMLIRSTIASACSSVSMPVARMFLSVSSYMRYFCVIYGLTNVCNRRGHRLYTHHLVYSHWRGLEEN